MCWCAHTQAAGLAPENAHLNMRNSRQARHTCVRAFVRGKQVQRGRSSRTHTHAPGWPLDMLKILVCVHRLLEPLHVVHCPSMRSPGTSPQSSKWPTCTSNPRPWNLPLLHIVHKSKMGRAPSVSPSVGIEPVARHGEMCSEGARNPTEKSGGMRVRGFCVCLCVCACVCARVHVCVSG